MSETGAIDFAGYVARRESLSRPMVRPRVWFRELPLGVAVTYQDEVIIPRSWKIAGLPLLDPK